MIMHGGLTSQKTEIRKSIFNAYTDYRKSMKLVWKISLTLLFLIITPTPSGAGKLGLYLGLTSSRIVGEIFNPKSDGPLGRIAPSGGVAYRASISRLLTLEPGVFISSLGAKEDWSTGTGIGSKVLRKHTYLDFPLILVIKLPTAPIAFEAGASINIPLSIRTIATPNQEFKALGAQIQEFDNIDVAAVTTSIIGGLRFYLPIPKVSPHIVLRIQHGVTPVIGDPSFLDFKNLGFSLFVGINI